MSLVTPVNAALARCPRGGLQLVRLIDGRILCPSCHLVAGTPVVGVSMLPYRAFAVGGSDDVVELVKTLELPLPPDARNQWVRLPDGSEHRVVRVVLQAREPATGPHGWAPGFKAVKWTEVELAPEAADQYETAARTAGRPSRSPMKSPRLAPTCPTSAYV
jgi:hypothetical protein